MEDQSDTPIITAEMVHNWRINYGLDVRSPRQAAAWWSEQYQGFAPAGAVAALGLCLEKITTATRERDGARAELALSEKNVGTYMAERNQARDTVKRARAELDDALAALRAIKLEAASLADAQVIALEALAATEPKP